MPPPTLEMKEILDGLNGTIEKMTTAQETKFNKLQRQVDAIDIGSQHCISNNPASPGLFQHLKDSDEFQRLAHDRRGRAIITLSGKDAEGLLQRKTTVTAVGQGFATCGVVPSDRDGGIVAEARQTLTVRDALTSRPTQMGQIDFVKVSTPMGLASPVAEASLKPENAVAFTSVSERVKVIATWIPASRQIVDDFSELAAFFEQTLTYYVNAAEELQLLTGDHTGENLNGLITQASPFNAALLSGETGFTKIDQIAAAIEQLTISKEIPPTFVVLNPKDWWGIRRLKDALGRYLLSGAQSTTSPNLFDLLVIPTTSIAVGTFLVGSGNPATPELRDRTEIQYEVSFEHADFFTRNLVACRAEKRLALIVKRPGSYVTGTFA